MKKLRITAGMIVAMVTAKKDGSVLAKHMHPATRDALVKRGLVEECARLYFGPRELQYRLTETGKTELARQMKVEP